MALVWPGSVRAGDNFRLLRMQGNPVKWGTPVPGTGARVTYAYVTATREFPDTINCSRMTSFDGLLAASGVSESALREEVAAAFAVWEKAANIAFVESDEATAQILIGAQANPRWFAFTNVMSHLEAEAPIGTIDQALICLNPRKAWKVGFDGDLTVYDLRYTFIHEIGHAIGLDHAGIASQLMSFAYREAFRDLQPGDVAGIDSLYGARPLPAGVASGGAPKGIPLANTSTAVPNKQ